MILPTDFLWHQLNGPQARAIEQAIYEYWKQMFDSKLDYMNQLDVENANDDHLNLLGIIANFVRPVIQVPDKDYFLFTEHPEHDNEKGLSALNNRNIGGRLTALKGASTGAHSLETEFYRTLLKTYRDSEGEIDSFILLDDICNALSIKDNPEIAPHYEFSIVETVDPGSGRGPGDVYIDIGSLTDWTSPFQIYAVINGLARSVFWPLPRIWTSLDTDVRCHTPTPDVIGGTYGEAVTVELTCTTPGSVIYYTLDGTEPTQEEGIPYTSPIQIEETTQLKARAWAPEKEPSFVYSTTYVIQTGIQLPQVISTLASGTYTTDQLVTLNCPFGLPVSIRYTLDGSEPTVSSTEYTEPFNTRGNLLLKAKAFRGAYEPSETTMVDARIMPPAVVIGPDIWTGSPTVTLTCTMDGVTILYSTDGNTPRTEYTGPFVLHNDTTVKAMAIKEGYTDSIISEKYFEINQVPPVQASIPSGTYENAQSVILSCPMSNVQIRYTLDGTTPTEASTDYIDGTSISIPLGTTVIKAKAWKGALSPSEVSTFEYTCERPKMPMYALLVDRSRLEDYPEPVRIYKSTDGLNWVPGPVIKSSAVMEWAPWYIKQMVIDGYVKTLVKVQFGSSGRAYLTDDVDNLAYDSPFIWDNYNTGEVLALCDKAEAGDIIIKVPVYPMTPGKIRYIYEDGTQSDALEVTGNGRTVATESNLGLYTDDAGLEYYYFMVSNGSTMVDDVSYPNFRIAGSSDGALYRGITSGSGTIRQLIYDYRKGRILASLENAEGGRILEKSASNNWGTMSGFPSLASVHRWDIMYHEELDEYIAIGLAVNTGTSVEVVIYKSADGDTWQRANTIDITDYVGSTIYSVGAKYQASQNIIVIMMSSTYSPQSDTKSYSVVLSENPTSVNPYDFNVTAQELPTPLILYNANYMDAFTTVPYKLDN